MTNKLPELSIFFPFWNEVENIEEVVKRAVPVAERVAEKWEILLIDDGSSDTTLQKAQKLSKEYPNVKVYHHTVNRGYGAALKTGFEHANHDFILFTDGDLQFDFSEVTQFIDQIEHADIVIGYRKKRNDSFIRNILMSLLKLWDYVFFQFHFKDIDCGFKMFRREAIKAIMPLRSEGAMITTEILAKAKAKKLRIKEVGVHHYPRKHGQSSGSNFSVITRAILETFQVNWDIKNRRF